MNVRKIKLALTVDVINKKGDHNILQSVKEMMNRFIDEVGKFVDLVVMNQTSLNDDFAQRTVAIRYENAILNVDVVMNKNTQSQHIQGFQLW